MTVSSPARTHGAAIAGQLVTGLAIGSGAAWLFVPTTADGLIIAVCLAGVAAVTGWRMGRVSGDVAGVVGALWFGYLHTEPRFSVEIADRADVVLTLSLLVVSLLASELADARRKLRSPSK